MLGDTEGRAECIPQVYYLMEAPTTLANHPSQWETLEENEEAGRRQENSLQKSWI